ncbi:MAG: hypothetical protein ACYTDE_03240 [Planctomycetota bacterium]|jgi:hypothetical protein
MKVDPEQISTSGNRAGEPVYSLPCKGLAIGWVISLAVSIGLWPLIGPVGWLDEDGICWAMLGAAIGGGIGGLGLLVIGPWKPRRSGDLPTLWLAATTARILAIPGVAFVLYSSIHPPEKPYVLGVAAGALALLVVEVPLIARAMLRQIAADESSATRSRASDG